MKLYQFILILICCSICSCGSKNKELIYKKSEGKYTIIIECEAYTENTSSIYITLNGEYIKGEEPVFVGSSSEPSRLQFTTFKSGQLIGVYWEAGQGKKTLIYVYSISDSLGWSRGKQDLSSDQLLKIKKQLLEQPKNEIDFVFGEVEN